MAKNKNLLIGVAIAVLFLIVGGVVLLLGKKSSSVPTAQTTQEQQVSMLKPEDIGLTLTMGADGQRVVMKITKTNDIASVDYELSYTSAGDIPRGAIGHTDVKVPGQSVSQEIVLGTCSDVCHYDKNVSNIKLVVKVTKTDENVFQVEQSLAN